MTRPLRVGWLLVGDARVASARIQGLSIHSELLRRGVRSEILGAPGKFDTRLHWKGPKRWFEAIARRRDVLVFQKVESSRAVKFARLARRTGTRVVFLQADLRESPLYPHADCVVVPSEELGRQLRSFCSAPIRVIEDPIDLPREVRAEGSHRTSGLRLLWIGGRLNFPSLEPLRAVFERPEFQDLQLVTVSDHTDATIPWSVENAAREIASCDAAVLPCLDTPAARAKSNNRLSMLMAAGLPVVATPIPAYETIVERGRTALLASDPGEWVTALRALRDPALRAAIGAAARESAWERFAPARVTDRWMALFAELRED